jgi:hypothetical protein
MIVTNYWIMVAAEDREERRLRLPGPGRSHQEEVLSVDDVWYRGPLRLRQPPNLSSTASLTGLASSSSGSSSISPIRSPSFLI